MKKIILIAVMIALIPVISFSQDSKKNEVRMAMEQLHQAMIDADSVKLSKLVLDFLTYEHSSGHIDHKKEFIEKITSGRSDFVTIQTTENFITISKKTAIVRHVLIATTNDSGKPGNVQLSVIQVWQKSGGRWRLLARKAAKML